MPKNGALAWVATALLAAILVALLLLVFQNQNLESRLIAQSRQIQALGDSTDRLAARLGRPGALSGGPRPGVAASSDAERYAHVTLRHPEVPNFLEEDDFLWPPAEATYDGRLLRGWSSGDPKGFNPLIENAAELSELVELYASSAVANRMVWTDPDRWAGDLAWRVEVTDDFKEYTIYLREGVQWQSPAAVDLDDERYAWLRGPHPFTAHDLAFTLRMIVDPQVDNGALKNYYADVEGWEVLDDHTLVVRWKRKLYHSQSATLGLAPVPEFLFAYDERGERIPDETLGLRFNQHWYNNKGFVGTGPYRLESYTPGTQVRMLRNEGYYGRRPAIRELLYPIYTDPNSTLLKLKARELSMGPLRPSQYREEILRWQSRPESEWPKSSPFLNGQLTCESLTRPAFSYIGWNMDKPLFADARVRRALTQALNRQGIIDEVYLGLGESLSGPILPSSPYYDDGVELLAFDPARSRELLAEAGWVDSDGDGVLDRDLDGNGVRDPFEFTLVIYAQSPETLSMANIFKQDLLKLGVKMNIEAAEWSLMQKRMQEKTFDAYTGGWALSWEVDLYQIFHSSQADVAKGSNYVGFRSEEADALMESLRETFETEERIAKTHRLHRILAAEQPYTYFRVPLTPYCWWDDVKDVVFARVRPQVNTLPWWVEN